MQRKATLLRRARAVWVCAGMLIAAAAYLSASIEGVYRARPQAASSQAQAATAAVTAASSHRALLRQYCTTCHNERLRTAGLMLDKLDMEDIGAGARSGRKYSSRFALVPCRRPRCRGRIKQPSMVLRLGWKRVSTARPPRGRSPAKCRPSINRLEYVNAIRDLVAVEIDSRRVLIDEDPGENGFDNTAGALSVSPALVERYISTAREISRLAVGDPTVDPVFETYKVPKMLVQDDRTSDDLPFASRGGVAIRHRFAVDGEYVVKIRLQSQLYQYILGLGRPHPLDVRLDGTLIKRFTVGGSAPGRAAPDSYAGDIPGDPEWDKYMHFADAGLEVRFPAKAGTRVVGISFPEFTAEPEGVRQPPQAGVSGITYNQMYDGNPRIETVAIGGPYDAQGPGNTASRQRIFICRPNAGADEELCAAQDPVRSCATGVSSAGNGRRRPNAARFLPRWPAAGEL